MWAQLQRVQTISEICRFSKICRFLISKNLQISADLRNPRYALLLCSRMLPLFRISKQPSPGQGLQVFGAVHLAAQLCTPDSENVFKNDSFRAKNLQIFRKSADFIRNLQILQKKMKWMQIWKDKTLNIYQKILERKIRPESTQTDSTNLSAKPWNPGPKSPSPAKRVIFNWTINRSVFRDYYACSALKTSVPRC